MLKEKYTNSDSTSEIIWKNKENIVSNIKNNDDQDTKIKKIKENIEVNTKNNAEQDTKINTIFNDIILNNQSDNEQNIKINKLFSEHNDLSKITKDGFVKLDKKIDALPKGGGGGLPYDDTAITKRLDHLDKIEIVKEVLPLYGTTIEPLGDFTGNMISYEVYLKLFKRFEALEKLVSAKKDITQTYEARIWNDNDIGKKVYIISDNNAHNLCGLIQKTTAGYAVMAFKPYFAKQGNDDDVKIQWRNGYQYNHIWVEDNSGYETKGKKLPITQFWIWE